VLGGSSARDRVKAIIKGANLYRFFALHSDRICLGEAHGYARSQTMDHRRYLKPSAAAEKLGVTIGTLGNWRWKGIGPAYYAVGGLIRYADDELDAWLAAGRQSTAYDRKVVAGARP
jgi:hypothetical protein